MSLCFLIILSKSVVFFFVLMWKLVYSVVISLFMVGSWFWIACVWLKVIGVVFIVFVVFFSVVDFDGVGFEGVVGVLLGIFFIGWVSMYLSVFFIFCLFIVASAWCAWFLLNFILTMEFIIVFDGINCCGGGCGGVCGIDVVWCCLDMMVCLVLLMMLSRYCISALEFIWFVVTDVKMFVFGC